jgi:hypothetical protein
MLSGLCRSTSTTSNDTKTMAAMARTVEQSADTCLDSHAEHVEGVRWGTAAAYRPQIPPLGRGTGEDKRHQHYRRMPSDPGLHLLGVQRGYPAEHQVEHIAADERPGVAAQLRGYPARVREVQPGVDADLQDRADRQ